MENEDDAYTYVDLEPEASSDHDYALRRVRVNHDDDLMMESVSDHDDHNSDFENHEGIEQFPPNIVQKAFVQHETHFSKAYHGIATAFELYDLKELAIADSGGKDSIVLNHLIDMYLSVHGGHRPSSFRLNIVSKEKFYDSDVHIRFDHKQLISDANLKNVPALSMVIVDGLSFCHALTTYHGLQPSVRAVFTGRRQSDIDTSKSNEKVDAFQGPTSNWPPLMRINPLGSWSYQQIWEYIDENNLPYPDAYRVGYTSLGPGAQPNPLLRRDDGTYRHARELADAAREREGRS